MCETRGAGYVTGRRTGERSGEERRGEERKKTTREGLTRGPEVLLSLNPQPATRITELNRDTIVKDPGTLPAFFG